jgi:chemotaxis protein methyltransferase CheR
MAWLEIKQVSKSAEALTPRQFAKIRTLVYDQCGIDLKLGKEELVKARLGKELRKRKLNSFDDYIHEVQSDRTGEGLIELINALSTNFTHFFREAKHFDIFRKSIAEHWAGRDQIDIWCAASSTGEEPYTIAVTLLEEMGPRASFRILASDISTKALSTAQAGIYPEARISDIPMALRSKYFQRAVRNSEVLYRVKPDIRARMEFRRINLIEPVSLTSQFPVIFCRNVMIYFDKPTQEKVVTQLTRFLEPGGLLFIGHAESLNGIQHSLQYVAPAAYRKPGDPLIDGRKR